MQSRALAFAIALTACSSEAAVRPLPSSDSDDSGAATDATATDTTTPDGTTPDATPDTGPTAPALHVLFIGNSYTYVNDLPHTLARIAETTFQRYAGLFAADARDAGATPTFYETWARVAGDPSYQYTWSGGSPSAMQDGMLMAYGKAATDANGVLVKVGEAWRAVLAKSPSIVLHQSDGSHPTPQGTWLAACVFYVRLTGNAVPTSSEVLAGVTPAEAAVLRDAALQAGH